MQTVQGKLIGLNFKITSNPAVTKIGFLIQYHQRETWYNAFSKSSKQIQMYRSLALNHSIIPSF